MSPLLRIPVALASIILEWKGLDLFLGTGEWAIPLIFHSVASVGILIVIRTSISDSEPHGWRVVLFLAPVVFLLPLFGSVFALGLILLSAPDRKSETRSRLYRPLSQILPENESEGYSFGVTLSSIAEIMRGGEPERRRQATLSLKNLKPVDSLPILRRLTQDDDEIVRLFALGEQRRIGNEFEQRSRSLARKRAEKQASVSELLLLAESYLKEVEIGLPADELQRKALLSKTLDVLWEARRRDPERMDIEYDILRCALAAFDIDVAQRAFHRLHGSGAYKNRLTLQECEYYFQAGDWHSLVETLFSLPESYRQSPRLERALATWDPMIRRFAGSKSV